MDLLTRDTVTELAAARYSPAVSILVPTHPTGPETRQDPIRLKNAVKEAQEKLVDQGMRSSEAEA